MTDLSTMLRDAAGPETPVFDAESIRSRVARRRRRRRSFAGAAVVVALVGVAAVALVARDDGGGDGHRVAAGPGPVEPLPAGFEDLVGARWVVRATTEVAVFQGIPWVEFAADGTVRGDNGACGPFTGRWHASDGVVTGVDVRGPETSSCDPPMPDLRADLAGGLALGRPDGADDLLQLGGWTLRRIDRIGRAASAADVVGMWEGTDGAWGITFDADGTAEVSAGGCRSAHTWRIDGDALALDPVAGGSCRSTVVGLDLSGASQVRIEGSTTLWLAGDAGVVAAYRLA